MAWRSELILTTQQRTLHAAQGPIAVLYMPLGIGTSCIIQDSPSDAAVLSDVRSAPMSSQTAPTVLDRIRERDEQRQAALQTR